MWRRYMREIPCSLEMTSASASAGYAVREIHIPVTSSVVTQVLFGALRRCQRLDLKGCVLLDGSVFRALAGTAATLTDLDCEGNGMVRVAARSPAVKPDSAAGLQ